MSRIARLSVCLDIQNTHIFSKYPPWTVLWHYRLKIYSCIFVIRFIPTKKYKNLLYFLFLKFRLWHFSYSTHTFIYPLLWEYVCYCIYNLSVVIDIRSIKTCSSLCLKLYIDFLFLNLIKISERISFLGIYDVGHYIDTFTGFI